MLCWTFILVTDIRLLFLCVWFFFCFSQISKGDGKKIFVHLQTEVISRVPDRMFIDA